MSKSFTNRLAVVALAMLGGCAVIQPPAPTVADRASVEAPIAATAAPFTPQLKAGVAGQFTDAVTRLQEGRLDGAEPLLRELTDRQPELAGPWLNLGRLQLERGDAEAARASFTRALEANPESCPAHIQLGVMLRREGKFEAARAHYQSCLAAHPDFSIAHLNLGILSELYLGDLAAALDAYQRYLELDPDAEPRVKGWVADLKRRLDA